MSALVILECNVCGAITPPWPSATLAREQAAPENWAVDVTGDDIDYCPTCTAPAQRPGFMPTRPVDGQDRGTVSRISVARAGVVQLRDCLAAMALAYDVSPTALASIANLARVRADTLIAELSS